MEQDGDYELLPHEELEYLRDEIARLKQSPLHGASEEDDLKKAVDRLTVTLNKFITIMTRTNEDLLEQFQQTSFMEQFSKINQNQEHIAKGIMSVAKLLQEQTTTRQTPLQSQPPTTPQQPPNQQYPTNQQENQPPNQQYSTNQPTNQYNPSYNNSQQDFGQQSNTPQQNTMQTNGPPSMNQNQTQPPPNPTAPHSQNPNDNPSSDYPAIDDNDLPPPPKKKGFFHFGK